MTAYTHNLFTLLQADGIVVNPYMGDDVMIALAKFTDKAIVVLAKTSNPSGGIIQDIILQNGWPLWRYVLDLIVNRWNKSGNMIPVIPATAQINTSEIRLLIPDNMPILLAGVGAQGGNFTGLRQLLNSKNIGVFVNFCRGILYPAQSGEEWHIAIKQAAVELKNILNQERNRESFRL